MESMRALMTARRLTRRAASERGAAIVEAVVIFPVMLTLIFLGIQAGLMYWGRAVAMGAAQQGARAAAAKNATSQDGFDAAESFASQSSAGVTDVSVQGGRGADTATYTVSLSTMSVIPGWDPHLTQTASMPVEKLT